MVKKLGQRRFLLKSGYTAGELDRMSPSTAHSLISSMEAANRKQREQEARISQPTDCGEIVEEIAKVDIEESAGFYSVFINDMRISKNKPLSISKTVMSFDCPKKYILQAIGIPEGSVVLGEEEYAELKFAKKLLELREDYIKSLEDANIRYAEALELKVNKKERKETAREILQELYDQIDEKTPKWVEAQIKMKAKQFGVELRERKDAR